MKRRGSTIAQEATTSLKRAKATCEPVDRTIDGSLDPGNSPADLAPSVKFQQVDKTLLEIQRVGWKIYSENELPGAEVFYRHQLIDSKISQEWFPKLEALEEWYHPILKVYGRSVTQSRAIAAYSTTSDLKLKYSGQMVEMHSPFPGVVREIQAIVEHELGLDTAVGFNHVMLNRYDSGGVYIGKHSDNKENRVIASLSLGAERTFIMSPRKGSPGNAQKWTLGDGSLLIMQGDTQANWKHEIPKELKVKGGRISLTFRQLEYD